jgi:hypothetical protein
LSYGDGEYSRRTVADVPADLHIDPEDGDKMLLRNVTVLFHEYYDITAQNFVSVQI